MAQVCEMTGRKPGTGNNVSHSQRKTKRTVLPNLQTKRYFIPEIDKNVTLRLSTNAIKSIAKHGSISRAILKAKEDLLSPRLQKIKRSILKAAK